MSALLALTASLLWGTSDFVGGVLSRSRSTISVLLGSQLATLPLALIVFVLGHGWHCSLVAVGWAAAAGVCALLGLGALYKALSIERMGVVAPISACGAATPVLVGLLRGEHVSFTGSGGIACILIGLIACSRAPSAETDLASDPDPLPDGNSESAPAPGRMAPRTWWWPLLLAAVSAAAFGAVLVFLALAGKNSAPMSLLVMRLASLAVLVPAAAWTGQLDLRAVTAPPVVAVGLLDIAANASYAVASRSAELSVVAVLASLYPAVTVLLARQLEGERLGGTRTFGVLATLAGVAVLSTAQVSL